MQTLRDRYYPRQFLAKGNEFWGGLRRGGKCFAVEEDGALGEGFTTLEAALVVAQLGGGGEWISVLRDRTGAVLPSFSAILCSTMKK